MDAPTEESEDFKPMERVISIDGGRNISMLSNIGTTTVRRKAANRTEPWYLATASSPPPPLLLFRIPVRRSGVRSTGQIGLQLPRYLASPPPPCSHPQDEDIPARKKPRLDPNKDSTAAMPNGVLDVFSDSDDEKPKAKELSSPIDATVDPYTNSALLGKKWTPISTARVEATTTTDSPGVSHAGDDVADDDANADSVMDTQSNPRAPGATGRWTEDEDRKLKHAVQIHGGNGIKDWVVITALVSGRTSVQCLVRWHDHLKSSVAVAQANGPIGRWTVDEDRKLNDALQRHVGKSSAVIAALVPGRSELQCRNRWHETLVPNIDPATVRTGKWTVDENKNLDNAVLTHGGKNWEAIAKLVPGRTKVQCRKRWWEKSVIKIDPTRAGNWTVDEDRKLKDAVPTQGHRNWEIIAALVPGRTKSQCSNRWYYALKPSIAIDPATARMGAWTADEDEMLQEAVQLDGGKDWVAIAALVPGRSKIQCKSRWNTGNLDVWTESEDDKLKEAVQMHYGKGWTAVAALVPGRTSIQCTNRWYDVLKHGIDQAAGRTR